MCIDNSSAVSLETHLMMVLLLLEAHPTCIYDSLALLHYLRLILAVQTMYISIWMETKFFEMKMFQGENFQIYGSSTYNYNFMYVCTLE